MVTIRADGILRDSGKEKNEVVFCNAGYQYRIFHNDQEAVQWLMIP